MYNPKKSPKDAIIYEMLRNDRVTHPKIMEDWREVYGYDEKEWKTTLDDMMVDGILEEFDSWGGKMYKLTLDKKRRKD